MRRASTGLPSDRDPEVRPSSGTPPRARERPERRCSGSVSDGRPIEAVAARHLESIGAHVKEHRTRAAAAALALATGLLAAACGAGTDDERVGTDVDQEQGSTADPGGTEGDADDDDNDDDNDDGTTTAGRMTTAGDNDGGRTTTPTTPAPPTTRTTRTTPATAEQGRETGGGPDRAAGPAARLAGVARHGLRGLAIGARGGRGPAAGQLAFRRGPRPRRGLLRVPAARRHLAPAGRLRRVPGNCRRSSPAWPGWTRPGPGRRPPRTRGGHARGERDGDGGLRDGGGRRPGVGRCRDRPARGGGARAAAVVVLPVDVLHGGVAGGVQRRGRVGVGPGQAPGGPAAAGPGLRRRAPWAWWRARAWRSRGRSACGGSTASASPTSQRPCWGSRPCWYDSTWSWVNAFAWTRAQEAWGRRLAPPREPFVGAVRLLLAPGAQPGVLLGPADPRSPSGAGVTRSCCCSGRRGRVPGEGGPPGGGAVGLPLATRWVPSSLRFAVGAWPVLCCWWRDGGPAGPRGPGSWPCWARSWRGWCSLGTGWRAVSSRDRAAAASVPGSSRAGPSRHA